ncbi:MAG: DUF2948 family protein [Enhydrobacter sp.]
MDDKLHLSALDADDLGVISAAVQDSLVAVRDCAWFADEKRFVLLLNRFRWEGDSTLDVKYWRTHSALVFNEVKKVHHHKSPLDQPDRVLDLLSVALEGQGSVVLRFAADRSIRLEIGRLACHLGDVGEPWPTPWKPAHP